MSFVDVGQHGSGKAGRALPDRNTPEYQISVLLGLMTGDRYKPEPAPEAEFSSRVAQEASPTQGQAGSVLGAAAKYLGIPYVYGGTDPSRGLDCSGFVQRAFADVGINLPRVTYDQVNAGQAITREQLQPGDLVFFVGDRGQRVNGHVGIYVGNGIMIDAPHTGAKVRYDKINWGRATAFRRVS